MSDIDQHPTEPSEGQLQIAGPARFDALLNELRGLLSQAPQPIERPTLAPMLRRASAHG